MREVVEGLNHWLMGPKARFFPQTRNDPALPNRVVPRKEGEQRYRGGRYRARGVIA